jgi:hypothetical protein
MKEMRKCRKSVAKTEILREPDWIQTDLSSFFLPGWGAVRGEIDGVLA